MRMRSGFVRADHPLIGSVIVRPRFESGTADVAQLVERELPKLVRLCTRGRFWQGFPAGGAKQSRRRLPQVALSRPLFPLPPFGICSGGEIS